MQYVLFGMPIIFFIASVAKLKLIAQVDLVLICAICIGISTIAVDEGSSILS